MGRGKGMGRGVGGAWAGAEAGARRHGMPYPLLLQASKYRVPREAPAAAVVESQHNPLRLGKSKEVWTGLGHGCLCAEHRGECVGDAPLPFPRGSGPPGGPGGRRLPHPPSDTRWAGAERSEQRAVCNRVFGDAALPGGGGGAGACRL